MRRRLAARVASACCAAILLAGLPASATAERTAELRPPYSQVGFDQKLDAQLPLDLSFTDETGRGVRLGDYFTGRRPVLLHFAYYTCPMLCTLVLNGVASGAGALNLPMGRDYEVVTVSIDPRDTPSRAAEKKRSYLREFEHLGEGRSWHFLTGDEESIRRLTEAAGFRYVYDPDKDQYAHASGVVVVTPSGRVARYFFGIDYAPRDLRLALVQASGGRIGTLSDKLMLLCYQYDPASGRYGATVFTIMRTGGLLTMVGLAAFFFVMLRRERRPSPTC